MRLRRLHGRWGWFGIGLALLLLLGVTATIIILVVNSKDAKAQPPEPTPTTQLGDMNLTSVEITQKGQTHKLVPGKFHDQIEDFVLEPGLASLKVGFTTDSGDTNGVEVSLTDLDDNQKQPTKLNSSGEGLFLLNLTIDDGQAWRFNPYQLAAKGNERKFEILAEPSINSGGMTGGNMVNTPDETGVLADPNQPQTVEIEIDPTFVAAFTRFCGFATTDIKKVSLKPNNKPLFQVAWTGTSFVQSSHQIAVGQPIWAAISKSGDVCYVNPPCGNPETVEGKLPPAPPELQPVPTATPGKEVPPTATNTPPAGSSPSPSATNTPKPPTATPVPPTATQTAAPTEGPCDCTPTDADRPTVIPTVRNTEVVPTNTPRATSTTAPDPQQSQTPATH